LKEKERERERERGGERSSGRKGEKQIKKKSINFLVSQ